jgi:concanavalin A-like lectin/glucanase superfamily protein
VIIGQLGGSNSWLLYTDATGLPFFAISEGTTQYSAYNTTLSLNRWYHLEGTYDGSYVRLYVNGVLQLATAKSGLTFSSLGYMAIGAATGNKFEGTIDDIRIYDYDVFEPPVP